MDLGFCLANMMVESRYVLSVLGLESDTIMPLPHVANGVSYCKTVCLCD